MSPTMNIDEMIDSLNSTQTYLFMESLYARNNESPVFHKKSVSSTYRELFLKVVEIVVEGFKNKNVKSPRDLPFTSIFSLGEMVVYASTRNSDILLEVMRPDYLSNFLPCHLLNVAILSSKVSIQLNKNFSEQTEIAVAGLLHDIGMAFIDQSVFSHEGNLSEEEKNIIRNHPEEGYKILEIMENQLPWLVKVVLEEHKREDGSGYPANVNGELHPYSKIIGLCDTFEALTHKRHHRNAYHPADVMKAIVKKVRSAEHVPNMVKALIETVSLYPVGSFVILNNEKVAQVVRAIPKNPLRPDIQIFEKDSNQTTTCRLIEETNLHIAGIVYDDNYQPLPPN